MEQQDSVGQDSEAWFTMHGCSPDSPISTDLSNNKQGGVVATLGLAVDVKVCVHECAHGALWWTGDPSKVYSRLTPSVPWIGFESTLASLWLLN